MNKKTKNKIKCRFEQENISDHKENLIIDIGDKTSHIVLVVQNKNHHMNFIDLRIIFVQNADNSVV